jgi:hypothetical protein
MIDYFETPQSPEEAALRCIKGNYRRLFISKAIVDDGLKSIPPAWLEHNLSEFLKGMLGRQAPSARGGEDLPDFENGEVEIARLTLANAVHGEVTSLRARPDPDGGILLRLADEYGTTYELPFDRIDTPLSPEQIIELFRDAVPSPADTSCEIELQSFFYPELAEMAAELQEEA